MKYLKQAIRHSFGELLYVFPNNFSIVNFVSPYGLTGAQTSFSLSAVFALDLYTVALLLKTIFLQLNFYNKKAHIKTLMNHKERNHKNFLRGIYELSKLDKRRNTNLLDEYPEFEAYYT